MPKVSIIIPTFNCELYIAETIKSILSQTYTDIEIIVVDDGSSDSTLEILSNYNYPVRLIKQKNAKVCAARNRGIKEAKGEFVCLMDHDDYWYPDKLALQVKQLEEHPEVGGVYSSFIPWHPSSDGQFSSPESIRANGNDSIEYDFSGWIYHQLLLDCWVLTSTCMLRSEVFENCGNFDESLPYSEDWDLWLRVSRKYRLNKLSKSTTLYRQHINQGNRIYREKDYRTTLLIQSIKKWGFCSQDGRCISKSDFFHNLAVYHAGYAFSCLQAGKRGIAISSFIKAWCCHPTKIIYLAYIPAVVLGWFPKW